MHTLLAYVISGYSLLFPANSKEPTIVVKKSASQYTKCLSLKRTPRSLPKKPFLVVSRNSAVYDGENTARQRNVAPIINKVTGSKVVSGRYTITTDKLKQSHDNGCKNRKPSLVRYRNRRNALKRTQSNQHPYSPPSELVESVMINQSEIVADETVHWTVSIIPRIYTWYMSWLLDLYQFLTTHMVRHSFKRWLFSCTMLTSLCCVLLSCIFLATLKLIALLAYVASAIVGFAFLLVFMTLLSVSVVVTLSFTGHSEHCIK